MLKIQNPLPKNVISPYLEMLAYEILWATEKMTEKKLTTLFHDKQLPSNILTQSSEFEDKELHAKVGSYFEKLEKNFSISIYNDFQYPEALQDAKYPVELFYYKGDVNLLNPPKCLSIVGARNCSEEGAKRARKLAKLLVEEGFTIVSGLAKGIDTAAMTAAINAGGRVIGVIGTPINQYYPKENKELQQQIATDQLLLSQVPFYRYAHEPFNTRKYYFPRRNVTMSAISSATIIVEASDTSGTLTQARAALEQNRKLFILDSCFQNSSIKWPHTYATKGAIRVKDVNDILKNLQDV